VQGRSTGAAPEEGDVSADDGDDEETKQDGMAKPADIAGNTSM